MMWYIFIFWYHHRPMMVFLVLLDITPYLASLHCSLQLLSQSLEDGTRSSRDGGHILGNHRDIWWDIVKGCEVHDQIDMKRISPRMGSTAKLWPFQRDYSNIRIQTTRNGIDWNRGGVPYFGTPTSRNHAVSVSDSPWFVSLWSILKWGGKWIVMVTN